MINIRNFVELYPGKFVRFGRLGISPSVERSDAEGSWGSALSLSIEETLQYCESKPDSFIPSAGMLFSVFKKLYEKRKLTEDEDQFLEEVNKYWHRTSSVLVFPTEEKPGYVLHYPELGNNALARDNENNIEGLLKLDLSKDKFPPYGEVARIGEHPDFFKSVLGVDCLKGDEYKKKLGMDVCLWIPPEECILDAPEKLIIFGAFAQYGMGLWLTSYTDDKTLVGSRPFRLAYNP
jgi:hypothetical protein